MSAARVAVCDVGPRDGLQNHPKILEPSVRAELVDRLGAAGLRRIEAVSFVHPGRVPQMAGAEEVIELIEQAEGISHSGLALNERGYERLAATSLGEVHYSAFASETFSSRNSNSTLEDGLATGVRIAERARADGRRVSLGIGVAFGCPFEGAIDPALVVRIAERLVAADPDEILVADTIGVAVPRAVRSLVSELVQLGKPVGVHLHNTRNTGFACAYAAIEAGASVLDASVGGLGGCPFAPRATGNICTEDLVYLLDGEGVETGIDLGALINVAQWLEGELGAELPGMVYKVGMFPPAAA